jgi:hypothetical protein
MTHGGRRLAAGAAALALLVGCSAAGARTPSLPPVSSPTQDRTAGGVEAARRFRSVRSYHGGNQMG